jgi:AraC-like DNA-binding protein
VQDATYQEILPSAELAEFLACVWIQTVGPEPYVHRVLPDGCADIISIADAAPIVVGPATGPVLVTLPANSLIVGARFRPGMAPVGFGTTASALLDLEVTLEDVWGTGPARDLWERLRHARLACRKLRALEWFFADRLSARNPVDEPVAKAVAWLARHPDRHVDELSPLPLLGLSGRQLRRRFREAVGYGPKMLHRVLRFQRLLVIAEGNTQRSLAGLAVDAGYLDQAHMSREVLALAGVTPAGLFKRKFSPDAMADFFRTVDEGGGRVGRDQPCNVGRR